ncbi:GNAT family N-acetyltransferase [Curtobacterium sp. VKM Ac-1393]|uniref:GNAT family N-acetyltransferase n=1 Tax=Curtobacterium sp. VKM Ac-1393 TaxID=2783814 RepID=UPI00188B37AE|nr:GNAT family N-acetyltransferase [Curtobacterium sp. VKM Ac-1393]MBF4606219.1 GNAT family N-acetyltransferase [Curtobacterium sp. VKM Ac-1393]
MTEYTVHELVVPATMDDDPETVRAFREWVDVQNRAEVSITGLPEMLWTPEEQLPYLIDPDAPSRLFLVRDDDGTAVGAGSYESKTIADAPNCWMAVSVVPEQRRRGIGTLLAEHVEAVARQQGRTQWKTYAVSRQVGPAAGPGYLRAPTGSGAVPEDEPGVRFLTGRGWRFGQVNRISRLELPADPDALSGIRAAATRAAADRYRVHTWAGPTPARWQADVALLLTRMSTDAPAGDMAEPEDAWTTDRLRTHEQHLGDGPRTMRTVAVEDVSSGSLVGFTQLAVPGPVVQPVMQGDTLVLREHRGHRLGWLLKAVGIETIERDHPGHPSIVTFNAEENRPMLDVNEAVGFVGVGSEGIWEHRPWQHRPA